MKVPDKILSYLAGRRSKNFTQKPPATLNKILAISSTAIGDTLFSIPALKTLKSLYPNASIELFVHRKYYRFFSQSLQVDKVLKSPKSFYDICQVFLHLRRSQFQIAMVFHESSRRIEHLAVLAGIPCVLRAYDDFPLKNHAIEQRMEVVRYLYGQDLLPPRMTLSVSSKHESLITGYLRKRGINGSIVAVCPGASRRFKMWPVEKFVELIRKILDMREDIEIAIIGSPNEKKIAKRIIRGISKKDKIHNLCGEIFLTNLPAFIKRASLVITNDTGPLHLAVAVGTKTVSLFVPTNPDGTGPYQDQDRHITISKKRPCGDKCVMKKCPYDPSCMDLIEVEEVYEAVEKLLLL